MPLRLTVDIEKVLSDFLRTHPDLTGLQTRFVGKTPDSTGTSWVRVTRIDGNQTDPADHLTSFLVQLDCYAGKTGGQPEANTVARHVRAAIVALAGSALDGAVIGATRIVGDLRAPDNEFGTPPRDRVILTVEIWAHA